MLDEFLTQNELELVARCRVKVAKRRAPRVSETELEHGIPFFLRQLIDALRTGQPSTPTPMVATAGKHGAELQRTGFTVAQVIHDYGDLCQAVTELAAETNAQITADEFHTFNRCLDDAIAGAVTEYARGRELTLDDHASEEANRRLGFLAHELRNLLGSARLSFDVIKTGTVALNGSTSALHERALRGLGHLIDRSLTEVRLSVGINKTRVELAGFIEDVEVAATLEADAMAIHLTVLAVDASLAVNADRQILASALANLLQNAFKFTREYRGKNVTLRVREAGDKVCIDVEDECGGLPAGKAEELFRPFAQRGGDRTGVGLGLAVSQRGVEANDGTLHVRNMPGHGCVFTVELPRAAATLPDNARTTHERPERARAYTV
jgi:signal transduction histidine kinase